MHDFKHDNSKELKFNSLNQATHGDVVIEKINKLPKGFKKMKSEKEPVLAYGEVTGHSHRMFPLQFKANDEFVESGSYSLKVSDSGEKFLLVEEPVVLKHQEHDPRIIPAGIYRTYIQREYDPFAKGAEKIRRVAD